MNKVIDDIIRNCIGYKYIIFIFHSYNLVILLKGEDIILVHTNSSNYNTINNNSQSTSTGLSRFSYADFVLLSSTISYAISEETSLDDLEILITFLGMISTDLTLLLIKKRRSFYNEQIDQQTDIDDETQDVSDDDVNISLSRNLNTKTIKRVKRKKRKKIP